MAECLTLDDRERRGGGDTHPGPCRVGHRPRSAPPLARAYQAAGRLAPGEQAGPHVAGQEEQGGRRPPAQGASAGGRT